MTTKQFVILMTILTGVCWGGWLMALFFINPQTTGNFGFILFYLSLYFALSGSLALLGFFCRYLFTKHLPEFERAQAAFRQALFFGLVIVSALFLQANALLTWLNAILLVALLTMVEFLIISLKKVNKES